MMPPDRPSLSQGFLEVPTSTTSIKEQRASTRSSGLRSSKSSARLSRNSSTSRSIKVFADVQDLLGLHGSSHIRLADHTDSNVGFRSPPLSIHDIDSGDGDVPQSTSDPNNLVQGVVQAVQDTKSQIQTDSQEPNAHATPILPVSEAPIITTSLQIYDEFPLPPALTLQNYQQTVPGQPENVSRDQGFPIIRATEIRDKQTPQVDKLLPQPPYHSFTHKKKLLVVILISLAGCLSPLSNIIYFPALNTIAADFDVSKESVLLTITAFMLVQGIAPVLRMPLESVGRRPVLVGTLFIFCGASLGLVNTRRFIMLVVLRAVQGGGSAALTAIGASVIGDISTAEEKRNFMGIFAAVLVGSHFVSPVIGGTLTYVLDFRSIFWVLFIFAATIMLLIIFLLPETLRSIAGNGTVRLGLIHRPFWSIYKSRDTPFKPTCDAQKYRPSLDALVEPFSCLRQENLIASIAFGSIFYAVWAAVLSTTALLFQPRFHLSTLLVGAAFLPSGVGSVVSFYLTTRIMHRDYRLVELRYRDQRNADQNKPLDHKSLPSFPIYRARLRSLWWIALIFIASTAGYGFSFLSPSIAAPLALQFLIAFSCTTVLFLNGVLVADTYPGSSASVIAVMNLIRFFCGALAVGTVQLLFNRLGVGFAFLTLAMIGMAFMPILLVQWVFGVRRESEDVSWWRWPSRFKNFHS